MSGRKRDRKCSEQACNVRSYRANVESVGSGRVAGSSPKIRQNKLAIVGGYQNQPFWIGSRSGLESQGQMSDWVAGSVGLGYALVTSFAKKVKKM
jgi:hypothetical protein